MKAVENLSGAYKGLKSYIRFLVNDLYYKDVQFIGTENIPPVGTPLLIVSDHQNSLNDALGIMLSVNDRKVHFIARADVFNIHPLATKFLYWIGLLPAFRIAFEGVDALKGNDNTFRVSEQRLLEGKTVTLYPEAGHQDRHWLGKFTYGYTRLAFEAAEMGNFEKEIFILPSCNHYSKYRGVRNSMLIKYGTPVSLAPYYELYKTKPRTAQREVNKVVRAQINDMMLNIEDLDNYGAIDFLRESSFGKEWAADHGFDASVLSSKLESDRLLVKELASRKEEVQPLLDETASLVSRMEELAIVEDDVIDPPSRFEIFEETLLVILLFPIAVFALWPSVLCWFIPKYFSHKLGDKMLESSFVVALNVLFILPICAILTLIFTWIWGGFLKAVAHALLLPFLCLFEWAYYKMVERLIQKIRFRKVSGKGLVADVGQMRSNIFSGLRSVLYGEDK